MIIYKLTSPSGKHYIGMTIRTLKQRLWDHVSEAKHGNRPIHNAINKYGIDKFHAEILYETECFNDLKEKEISYIAKYDTTKTGYNLSTGGEGSCGIVRSDEYKELQRQIKLGKKQSPETIAKRVEKMKGFKQSDHQKKRAREANSKSWLITHPNGKTETITNLNEFCRQHNLQQCNLVRGSSGGFKAKKIG